MAMRNMYKRFSTCMYETTVLCLIRSDCAKYMVGTFNYFQTAEIQPGKTLVRLCLCANSLKPCHAAHTISWPVPEMFVRGDLSQGVLFVFL